MQAAIFPGQGSQFVGMGKDLYNSNSEAAEVFEKSNEILGFDIKSKMFEGDEENLKNTEIAQLAILIVSIASTKAVIDFYPKGVAGHSLGEYSALTSVGSFALEDALLLIKERSQAMHKASLINPGSMLAVLGLEEKKIVEVCDRIGKIQPANFNSPSQTVISGSKESIDIAKEAMIKAGARRVVELKVSGPFHTHMMEPAKEQFIKALDTIEIKAPRCPVYQNVNAKATQDPVIIKHNLIEQLSEPIMWTQTINNMISDGFSEFVEYGPGKVLQGLVKKINPNVEIRKYKIENI